MNKLNGRGYYLILREIYYHNDKSYLENLIADLKPNMIDRIDHNLNFTHKFEFCSRANDYIFIDSDGLNNFPAYFKETIKRHYKIFNRKEIINQIINQD